MASEAAKSDLRNRAPPTLAQIIYPHLRSDARAAPDEQRRVDKSVAETLYSNHRSSRRS
jgi:hypothetical protein